jgi:5-methyltetrahydrofolate--homocysteine methyltransferase
VIARVGQHLEATRYHGDAYPRWFVNFGPGIVAGFVGAVVHSVPETVWFEPQRVLPPSEIHPVYQADNVWWQRVRDLTRCAVATWGKQVQVSHTDFGGNLDVVASLRTTQALLTDLLDAPEEVERLVREVTALWLRYYDELDAIIYPGCRGRTAWAPIWSPETTYMLQSDFAYMISPAMFARFVMPDLIACCEHLEHGFYHLDGKGQIPHLDQLLSIPRLRGVQWIPGDGAPPPDQWLWLLKRIRDGGKLCQVYVTAEGARTIVKNLGGKGFMLTVGDEMTWEEADAFLKVLASEDISRR